MIKNLIVIKNTDLNALPCEYFIRQNKNYCAVFACREAYNLSPYDYNTCLISKHKNLKMAELKIKKLIREDLKNGK